MTNVMSTLAICTLLGVPYATGGCNSLSDPALAQHVLLVDGDGN